MFNDVIIHSGGVYADVDLGDMDGDGDIDIVVMDELEDSPILIFTNNQTETFGQNRTQHLINTSNNNLYLLDMDEDGDLDIVTNGAFDGLWMIENNDELYVSDEKVYFATQQVLYFNTADLNNDGLGDFVFLGGNNFGIFALINLGDFQFSEPIEIALFDRPSAFTRPNINYVANNLGLYDYDSDGKTDIVYTDGFSELNKIILYQNTTMTSSVDNPTLSTPAFSIVPNLVQDQFQIQLTNGTLDQDQLYTIYSMEGKKVLEGNVGDGFVDVGSLQGGFYNITLTDDNCVVRFYKKQHSF